MEVAGKTIDSLAAPTDWLEMSKKSRSPLERDPPFTRPGRGLVNSEQQETSVAAISKVLSHL
jgi:hypothetical protein